MQSLPFRLLDVNELDIRDVGRRGRHNWHPPGVVEDSEYESLWRSQPNSLYPQELGLILLSLEPITIKRLRVTVELARAPSRLEISAARQEKLSTPGHLDAVSRYLSASWTPYCEALIWEACASSRTDTPREIDSKAVHLDISSCSFVRLVLYAPHESARNRSHEVVLEDIEVLGLTEDTPHHTRKMDPNLRTLDRTEHPPNHSFGRVPRDVLLSPDNDSDELQSVLLDAGVPMSLVAQIATIPDEVVISHEGCESSLADAGKYAPELFSQDNELIGVPESSSGTTALQKSQDDINQDKQTASPFDQILRQYIEQTAREKAVLEKILATESCKSTDEISSWQSPTISPTDTPNTNEVALYTFGAFFTQCMLCGGSVIQVMCIQMVERYARLLKDSIGATSMFEGVVAIILIGVREAKSSHVFCAAIHLAHTAFSTTTTSTTKATLPSQPVNSESGNTSDQNISASSVSTSLLDLVEELDHANLSYGLRIVLESTLASPICWSSTNHTSSPLSHLNGSRHRRKVSSRLSNVPPSIDRAFLQFIRLLIEQNVTRTCFLEELLDLIPADSDTGTIFTANRFRLLRLVMRDGKIRCQISTNTKTSIHSFCSHWLTVKTSPGAAIKAKHDDKEAVIMRLAEECLDEIDRSSSSQQTNDNTNSVKGLLVSVHRHLQVSSSSNSYRYHSHRYCHTALFVQDPLTESETDELAKQMQRYFSAQPRPNALYRHAFVRAPRSGSENGEKVIRELFQKGNITFQGQVVPRIPPKETFHEEIERKAAPFVFDIYSPNVHKAVAILPPQPPPHQEIVSSFAAFQGTIERRSDTPKRTSKVSPEDHVQTSVVTKTLETATKQPGNKSVNSTTAIDTLSGDTVYAAANISIQDARNSKPIEDSALSKQATDIASPTSSCSALNPAKVSQNVVDFKQTTTVYQPNQHKREAKVKGNEKGKGTGKSVAKSADHCILQ